MQAREITESFVEIDALKANRSRPLQQASALEAREVARCIQLLRFSSLPKAGPRHLE